MRMISCQLSETLSIVHAQQQLKLSKCINGNDLINASKWDLCLNIATDDLHQEIEQRLNLDLTQHHPPPLVHVMQERM